MPLESGSKKRAKQNKLDLYMNVEKKGMISQMDFNEKRANKKLYGQNDLKNKSQSSFSVTNPNQTVSFFPKIMQQNTSNITNAFKDSKIRKT